MDNFPSFRYTSTSKLSASNLATHGGIKIKMECALVYGSPVLPPSLFPEMPLVSPAQTLWVVLLLASCPAQIFGLKGRNEETSLPPLPSCYISIYGRETGSSRLEKESLFMKAIEIHNIILIITHADHYRYFL